MKRRELLKPSPTEGAACLCLEPAFACNAEGETPASPTAAYAPGKVRVICVAGARPNFMKVAPLLRALRTQPLFDTRLVHTGQHYDSRLSSVFFQELSIPEPDMHLDVGSGTHAYQTAELMRRFEPVLAEQQPQVVLVVGDVNSTIACALVAAKFLLSAPFRTRTGQRRRPLIAHVEAGLRSYDSDMPEEANRRLTDALSDLLYVSEPVGVENLAKEGISGDRVVLVGNVMIDTLLSSREQALRSPVLAELGLTEPYGILTLHRPSNVDDPVVFAELLSTLDCVARKLPLVFPNHPRTQLRMRAGGLLLDSSRWHVTEPLGYLAFTRLLCGARVVLTDSGGIQEESTVLGIPCLTLRNTTERPVTVEQGTNQLVGTTRSAIESAFLRVLAGDIRGRVPDLWDGRAAERIVEHLQSVFTEDSNPLSSYPYTEGQDD